MPVIDEPLPALSDLPFPEAEPSLPARKGGRPVDVTAQFVNRVMRIADRMPKWFDGKAPLRIRKRDLKRWLVLKTVRDGVLLRLLFYFDWSDNKKSQLPVETWDAIEPHLNKAIRRATGEAHEENRPREERHQSSQRTILDLVGTVAVLQATLDVVGQFVEQHWGSDPTFLDHSLRHSRRILEYADELAKPFDLNAEEAFVLASAAFLHDLAAR